MFKILFAFYFTASSGFFLFSTGKKKLVGCFLKCCQLDEKTNRISEKGMFLDRKARSSERIKLTRKFMRPMIPIPRMPSNSIHSVISKSFPYSPNARFPLANVMCLMSRSSPIKAPIEAVDPMNTPNQRLDIIPAHFFS